MYSILARLFWFQGWGGPPGGSGDSRFHLLKLSGGDDANSSPTQGSYGTTVNSRTLLGDKFRNRSWTIKPNTFLVMMEEGRGVQVKGVSMPGLD